MRTVTLMATCLGGLVCGGCVNQTTSSEAERFFSRPALEIRVAKLASGMNYWYEIWGSRLRVTVDDSTASTPKVVHDGRLDRKQEAFIWKRVGEMPLDKLKGWYETPGITDGIFIEFRIPDGRGRQRIVRINNYYQPDLMRLTAHVDSLLPKKLRIDYRRHEGDGLGPPSPSL